MTRLVTLKKVLADFKSTTVELCTNPRHFVEKFGTNMSSVVWGIGSIFQASYGVATVTPNNIWSSGLNGATALTALTAGHKNWGVAATCVLTVPAFMVDRWAQLSQGDPWAIMVVTACTVGQVIGGCSGFLADRFENSPNALFRKTLGKRPRAVTAAIMIPFVQMPSIMENLVNGGGFWGALPYACFVATHCLFGASKPQETKRAARACVVTSVDGPC